MSRTSKYFDVKKDANGKPYLEVYTEGLALLRIPMTNKGTAFTHEERIALGIDGHSLAYRGDPALLDDHAKVASDFVAKNHAAVDERRLHHKVSVTLVR